MSSGQVGDVKIADPLQVFVNLRQYVFTHHTHVVDVVKQLHLRTINAPDDLNSKRRSIEKTPAMIERRIQRLKEQGDARRFRTASQRPQILRHAFDLFFRWPRWRWRGAAIVTENIAEHHDAAAVQLPGRREYLVHLCDQLRACVRVNERVLAIPAHSCDGEAAARRRVSERRQVFVSPVPELDGAIAESRCDVQALDEWAIGEEHFQAEREFHWATPS